MKLSTLLLAPVALVSALPTTSTSDSESTSLLARQARRQPAPCVRQNPPPSQAELEVRFNDFVDAFVGRNKNITKAFEYIVEDYINHNPAAQNGAASAWNILSPIWHSIQHSLLRSTIRGDMSWVNYNGGFFGTIVDRFRWEGGCIAEHWDQGERYPAN
ncbi:hypothetical protein QBC38DRAFT_373288 [Podospora fimiseda]|uniref:SnoaL-like domain-containing protein n=1 Tax=Podospora fimiseda TaxID=252190 RepID=A0AAN7BHK8_9PEZI|nr:hypothetical protein QBC38DRAFT_373288 [Podospora fimiseda]